MTFNPDIHNRHSIRLRDYDYSSPGAYFLTICTHQRECLFGDVANGEMHLNDSGRMVAEVWHGLPGRFPMVTMDEFVVMPNHFHGIVMITETVGAGSPRPESTSTYLESGGETPPLRKPTLGQVMGYFKYQAAKQVNMVRDMTGVPLWQRNYYERVIRNEAELAAMRAYIGSNPAHWMDDHQHPHRHRRGDSRIAPDMPTIDKRAIHELPLRNDFSRPL